MKRLESIDESREALLDRLFLIYTRTADAVGRYMDTRDEFDIFGNDGVPMGVSELEGVLQEFYHLCKNPDYKKWNFFPANARVSSRLFSTGYLDGQECLFLMEFIQNELPLLREYMEPEVPRRPVFDFLRGVSGRAAQILIK